MRTDNPLISHIIMRNKVSRLSEYVLITAISAKPNQQRFDISFIELPRLYARYSFLSFSFFNWFHF